MSAQPAPAGTTEVPQPVFPPLPEVTEHLHIVHYATDPRASAHATPPVAAIVVQNVLTGAQMTFAAITEAEAAGVPPETVLAQYPDFEREALSMFADFATTRPEAVWVHWRMRDAIFGFDALNRRATVHRTRHHGIPPARRCDLSHHLERRYGDQFAPRPRLWNAIRRNLGATPELLDRDALATAWEDGNHTAVLRSLTEQVTGISRLFERARLNKFISGAGEPFNGTESGPEPIHTPSGKPSLLRGNVTASPGPPIQLHPAVFDPKRLTDRHSAILDELFKHQAHDLGTRLTTEQIARAVDGPDAKVAGFKHPISQLREWGCVDTETGRAGGVWLTEAGRALADINTK